MRKYEQAEFRRGIVADYIAKNGKPNWKQMEGIATELGCSSMTVYRCVCELTVGIPEHVKERQRQRSREYRKKNREACRERDSKWYAANREYAREQGSRYYAENTERWLEWNRLRRSANTEKAKEQNKRRHARDNERRKERVADDPAYRLMQRCRCMLRNSLRRKGLIKPARTFDLVGCSIDELKVHIESLFKDGMCWERISEIHIDHIRPVSSFDFTDPEQVKQCFHFSNLQPLWAADNIRKSNKIL